MLGCIGKAEIGRQINAATTLSLFCSIIFCILVIRLEVGCSCCSCCSGALHHNLLLTARNSTLLISQCGGVLVQCPHWVFGVGLSFNCIVKLINWYISIVFILIGLRNKNTYLQYTDVCDKKIFGSTLEPQWWLYNTQYCRISGMHLPSECKHGIVTYSISVQ